MQYHFHLERYKTPSSRYTCPQCGHGREFTRYVDDEGNHIDPTCGRCNREVNCGYHLTPSEFFTIHPEHPMNTYRRERVRSTPSAARVANPTPSHPTPTSYIDWSLVERFGGYNNAFVEFLCGLFDLPTIKRVCDRYAVGSYGRDAVFWQIDITGRVRSGKVMAYNPDTGHRNKAQHPRWMHNLERIEGYNLKQCLFGEHLLRLHPSLPVGLVESEKTAVIMAAVLPQFLWLATGGKGNFSRDRLRVLQGREVVIFPDIDGHQKWSEQAKSLDFCKSVKVSSILEDATPQEREAKIDIADRAVAMLERKRSQPDPIPQVVVTAYCPTHRLQMMVEDNPCIGALVDALELVVIDDDEDPF